MRCLSWLLLLLVPACLQAQMYWKRPIYNHTRKEYRASNQNWMIAQHKCGWMYFANNSGLLEYDGAWWSVYPMAGGAKPRSVLAGRDGLIYVGGQREFGYFTPNAQGGLTYTSLSSRFDPKTVTNIWDVVESDGSIYFLGDHTLFRYHRGKVSTIEGHGITKSVVVNGRVWFNNYMGLSYVHDGKAIVAKGTDQQDIINAAALLQWNGRMLIVTSGGSLLVYDGKQAVPLHLQSTAALRGHKISCAAIDRGILAVGTTNEGLFLFDLKADRSEQITIANGLQSNSLLSVSFDRDHNLWAGLDNGIDYVPLNNPLYFLASPLMSIGGGYCSALFGGKLYLGTSQGLFRSTVPGRQGGRVDVVPMPGLEGQTNCLYPYRGWLFCGGRSFFCMTDGLRTVSFPQRGVWNAQAIGDGNTVVIGTYWGLRTVRYNGGTWTLGNEIDGLKFSAKTMLVEPETNNVWVANKTDGIWRLMLDTRLTKVKQRKCYNNSELPQGSNVCITLVGSDIVVASKSGLFRYDATRDRLLRFTELERRLNGRRAYTYLHQSANGSLWYVFNSVLGRSSSRKGGGTSAAVILDNMIEDFENVREIDPYRSIAGTGDGFVMIDERTGGQAKRRPTVQIRRLYVTNGGDSVVYGQSNVAREAKVSLPYRSNSIRITYTASDFDQSHAVSYSCRLKGLDNEWSEYSQSTSKEFANLREGRYTFEVRVRVFGGKETGTARLSFRVLPPWYRSWWAFVVYALLVGGTVWMALRRVLKKHERIIRQKDEEIEQQKEIYKQDIGERDKQIGERDIELGEKSQQIAQLEAERLRSELQYKSDELMKSTLNVVRKNESLQKIRKEAQSLAKLNDEGDKVKVKRGIFRLINQIDTNIEHDSDLKNFESSFDAVHHDFLKKLAERYPELNHKDRMLCAYIRMNLMSKEIAPLLNISTRGVEISRYRLRKKMGLDSNVNLTEFLNRI